MTTKIKLDKKFLELFNLTDKEYDEVTLILSLKLKLKINSISNSVVSLNESQKLYLGYYAHEKINYEKFKTLLKDKFFSKTNDYHLYDNESLGEKVQSIII